MFSTQSKITALCLTIALLMITLGTVLGTPPQDTITPDTMKEPALIWNSNGQSWPPTWQNLQTSLNCTGVTYFPARTIITDQTITMPSDSAIIGVQGFSILKANTTMKTHLIKNADQTDGNTNLHIEGLTLDGTNPAHTNIQYGVLWTKVTDGTLKSVTIKNTGKDGIRFVTCQFCTASQITIDNTGHHAVMFCYGTKYSEMSHIVVKRTEYEPFIIEHPNPQTQEPCHDITMTDCVSQRSTQFGCYIGDCYNVAAANIIVNGSSGEGFEITECHDVTLTNCITSNNLLGPGFEITETASRIVATNCIVKKPKDGMAAGFALYGQHLRLTNCMSFDTAQPLIFEQTTSKDISVSSSTFSNFSKTTDIRGDTITLEGNAWRNQSAEMGYIIVIITGNNILLKGNDFRGTQPLVKTINDANNSAIIIDNLGFPTDVYRQNANLHIGMNNDYGDVVVFKSAEQHFENPMIRLISDGMLSEGEKITVKIEAMYSNGYARSIEKSITTVPTTLYLTTEDWFNLAPTDSISTSLSLYKLIVSAKSSRSTTNATCTVSCLNLG
jgi:hypothetical protein